MNETIEHVVDAAERTCSESGLRLTPKRRNVLLTLLRAGAPLSAYELAAEYQVAFGESIPTMSVYRMLNFLVQVKLAHKLDTTNQYLACAHITCDHQHEVPQFLICDQCHRVSEIGVGKALVEQLKQSVERTGFQVKRNQLELHGVCASCSEH
jgi:Fur family zinc uptake transcriptional regulator